MGNQEGEISAKEAAAMLGLKKPKSIYDYEARGLLTARIEPRGVFGRVRKWYRREDVERLKEGTQ